MKLILKVHSVIDVITNSSSELFCNVRASEQELVEEILDKIVKDFGCSAVEFRVDEAELYSDDIEDYEICKGVYSISYDYECNKEPCKMMLKKIQEVFEIVEE